MFIGTYKVKTDLYGQFAIPRPIMDQLGVGVDLLMFPSEGPVVKAYPSDAPPTELAEETIEIELDEQGRTCLTLMLMEHLGIEPGRKIIVTGMMDHIEISVPG